MCNRNRRDLDSTFGYAADVELVTREAERLALKAKCFVQMTLFRKGVTEIPDCYDHASIVACLTRNLSARSHSSCASAYPPWAIAIHARSPRVART